MFGLDEMNVYVSANCRETEVHLCSGIRCGENTSTAAEQLPRVSNLHGAKEE
jgi:hypothetical protein